MPIFPVSFERRSLAAVALLLIPFSDASAALDFDTLKSRNPTPPAAHIIEVSHENGRWVLGSDGGYITHSADGESWSTVTVDYGKGIGAFAYWDGRYFAGGVDSRTLLESTDLVNWTKLDVWSTDFPFNIQEFHFAFGKLHAVGASPGLSFTTAGSDWTEITVPLEDGRFDSMASNDTRAILVGRDGTILSSENGTDWTVRPVSIADVESSIDDDFLSVRWVNGLFVAGGKQGLVATSPDGLTWTHRVTDFDDWLYTVVYVDGTYIFPGRQGKLRTTTDFITWSEIETGSNGDVQDLYLEGDRLLVGGRNGIVAYSDDRSSWNISSQGTSENLGEIAFGADVFVATDFNGAILKSNDSESWTEVFHNDDLGSARGLVWDGSQFVVVTRNRELLTSPDGENWTQASSPITDTSVILEQFVLENGLYWVVGYDGFIARSTDLTIWNEVTIEDHRFTDLCYGGGLYLAVGQSGDRSKAVVYTSPDGAAWTERDGGFPADNGFTLNTCVYADGRYVTAGSSWALSYSDDGINWTHDDSTSTPRIVNDLSFYEGEIIAMSVSGTVWRSADATSWSSFRLRTTQGLADYIEAAGRTVVVGTNGTILSTDLDLGNTYAAWREERFSPAQQLDDSISGPDMDPDEDGRSNAFEFFSNSQPLIADEGGPYTLEIVDVSGTRHTGFSLRRNIDLTGISLDIQHSSNLGVWSSLDGEQIVEETVTPLDDETEEVLYRLGRTISAPGPDFIRVETVLEE